MEKAELDKLLDQPAFGPNGQFQNPSLDTQIAPVVEPKVEEGTGTSSPENEDEGRVPYSRFKKVRDELKQKEAEAAQASELRDRLAALENEMRRGSTENTVEVPDWWKDLLGDSEESKKGYQAMQKGMNQSQSETRELLRKELLEEQSRERANVKGIEDAIDDEFEELQEATTRKFSDTEKAELLQIVDDYTPQDKDGNFLGVPLALDKALEIYDLKQAGTGKREARNRVARLSGTSSQGQGSEPSPRPRWSDWQKRLP